MRTPIQDHEPPPPFSYRELAELDAGLCAAENERDLRERIDRHPEAARRMRADLSAVDRAFPDPPDVDRPLAVPAGAAARWRLAVAREADRRAGGSGSEHATLHDAPPGESPAPS